MQFLRPLDSPKKLFVGALGEQSVDGMPTLPGTIREADAIARLFPNAERVTNAAFTHDRVREALQQFPAVHLATHGLLDERAPLFSSVLTAPSAGAPSRLSLYEIADMR